MSEVIQAVTETEEQQIRDEYAEFVIGTGQKCKRLHLPDTTSEPHPLCNGTHLRNTESPPNQFRGNGWDTKPVSVYPSGYRELCMLCVRKWRQE